MEFGPRALGNRSILADARRPDAQRTMNLKIKYRESFRPFAPIVAAEDCAEYFDFEGESPYMLMVAPVRAEHRRDGGCRPAGEPDDLLAIVNQVRSDIPAVTHVDHSARLQTVDAERNPELHRLLAAFRELTGCSVLVNTSFNVRGEPIVCSPEDAYRCFMRTEMDVLLLGEYLLERSNQPPFEDDPSWRQRYGSD